MQTEAKVEYQKIEKEEKQEQRGETNVLGVRTLLTNPIPACDKIDRIFGSGGEAIIHYMWFEQGNKLFEEILNNSPSRTKEELLKRLIDAQPQLGWGAARVTIAGTNPPMVKVAVKNPPVKKVEGSQKHLIGSFWAGVFSKYFERQMTAKNFVYNGEKDEFSCLITT